MRRWTILLVLGFGVLSASCGNDNPAPVTPGSPGANPTPTATPTWAGYPEPAEGLGEISITEFNAFMEEANPPWRAFPLRATLEFIWGGKPPSKELPPITTTLVQKTTPETGTEARVTLVEDGLYDDSTAAVRYRLEFERQNGGIWRLTSAFVDQRCARGPDTKSFTTEPCI